MNFDKWLKNRQKPGTLEYLTRTIASGKLGYQISVATFKIMLLAEMFLGNGGNLGLLSEEVGLHRWSISRLFKTAGFDKKRLLKVARDEDAK
jgi:hypothetical protein